MIHLRANRRAVLTWSLSEHRPTASAVRGPAVLALDATVPAGVSTVPAVEQLDQVHEHLCADLLSREHECMMPR